MPETGFYIVSTFEELKDVLGDPEQFSNRSAGFAAGLQGDRVRLQQEILREKGWGHVATLQRTDPPEHTRYRKLLNRVFTARRVASMAPHIDEVTNMLIDRFIDRGECEFMSEFALPLPGIIIAEELGLSADGIETFARWADAMLAPAMRILSEEETRAAAETELEAQHHLAVLFEDRRENPRDDLISALVHAHGDDEEPLSVHELQNLMHQLVTGGFETTTSSLGHAMWLLVRHPDQLALLRADDRLMKGFIEESLRIESPVQGLARRTTRDVEVGGVTIPEGSMVLVRYGAANRDDDQFSDADTFDICRANSASHLAFGAGNHYCIGAALARQEMHSAFTNLLRRLDEIELAAPMPDPAHHPSMFLLPLKELRLRFRAKS
jgi:cytochrome P450